MIYLDTSAKTPFPAADVFECWLLDAADASPLALIFSCCEESQIPTYAAQTKWTAVPSSKLKIEQTDDESRMAALRVEARLRRGMPQGTEPSRKKTQTNAPLSKEMRILE